MTDDRPPRRLRASPLRGVLLLLTLLMLLCSLLVVVSAPTASLWVVAILVAEWGHYFAIACLVLAALSWRRDSLGISTTLLGVFAALLYLSPALKAQFIGSTLPDRCS